MEHLFIKFSHKIDEVPKVLDCVLHLDDVVADLPLHAVLPVMLETPLTLLQHSTQRVKMEGKLLLEKKMKPLYV